MAGSASNKGKIALLSPGGLSTRCHEGDTILDALLAEGWQVEHECGGNCACTTCRVRVLRGWDNLSNMESPERERLAAEEKLAPRMRLACQALLAAGDVEVEISACEVEA